jgi:hypothetical protein
MAPAPFMFLDGAGTMAVSRNAADGAHAPSGLGPRSARVRYCATAPTTLAVPASVQARRAGSYISSTDAGGWA